MTSDGRPALSLVDPIKSVHTLLTHPSYFWPLALVVLIGDAVLTQLIIRFIPYTEIDFSTYMEQVNLYDKGERDYVLIAGSTGPVVYPAGHIHIHSFLSWLSNGGKSRVLLQQFYGTLYLLSLAATLAIHRQAGNIPNGAIILLAISKRLHSIYVLRLFNDCWTVLSVLVSVLSYGRRQWVVGSVFFSMALLMKMNVLLYLPAVLLVLFQSLGMLRTLEHVFLVMLPVQVLPALPFLLNNPASYLRNAFNLGRAFLYKWTVNWRFIPEDIFLSDTFTKALLVGHLATLLVFLAARWSRGAGGVVSLVERGLRRPALAASIVPLSADYITTIMFTANLIGVLFARSLHYQFYSWYALQVPFLLWRTSYPLLLKVLIWLCIEVPWNVYPSTKLSSIGLLLAHSTLLIGIFFGYPEGRDIQRSTSQGKVRTG